MLGKVPICALKICPKDRLLEPCWDSGKRYGTELHNIVRRDDSRHAA
jgi:hypothetical protein